MPGRECSPRAVLVPLLALEMTEDEVVYARDHLLLRDESVLLGNVVVPVELAASGRRKGVHVSICVGTGRDAAGGRTSAPAVEDATLHH